MSKYPYRWPCSVPGCRRTIGSSREMNAINHDWALCTKHWPMVPKAMKRALRRAAKRHEKAWFSFGGVGTREVWLTWRHADIAYDRLASRIVRYAIEASMGIG